MQNRQTMVNLLKTIRDVLDQDIFPNLPVNQLETAEMTQSGLDIVIRSLTKSPELITDSETQEISFNTSNSFFSKHSEHISGRCQLARARWASCAGQDQRILLEP